MTTDSTVFWAGLCVAAATAAILVDGRRFQDQLRYLVWWGRQRRYAILRSRGPIDLQTVSPSLPVRAILWMLGRPWEGSASWPNRFLFVRCQRSGLRQHPNGRLARTARRVSIWVYSALWSGRTQLTLLLFEIVMLLLGGRGSRRRGYRTLRQSEVDNAR